MHGIRLFMICTCVTLYAADPQHITIPAFLDIPYFTNVGAARAKKPTGFVTVPITPDTTLITLQNQVRDAVGTNGFLWFGNYKNLQSPPRRLKQLARKTYL